MNRLPTTGDPRPGSPAEFALDFSAVVDGVPAHVKLPGIVPREVRTVETYVTPRSADDPERFRHLFTTQGMELKQRGDCWIWVVLAGEQRENLYPAGVVPGQRVHLAGVLTNREMKLFLDGKSIGERPLTLPLAGERSSAYLGGAKYVDDKGLTPLSGTIDEVRLPKVSRYDRDFTPPQAPFANDSHTLALYHCDEGQGDELTDSSGNGNHGKIVGAKWVPWIAGGLWMHK
jgi:hypothetical protein